ncbi:MAG TPA: 50S ribosomal protein L21 [Candidatus Dormibacteraeota bacterium]
MYAIVQQGGHQYRLAPGDRFLVDRMAAEVGSMITLEPVLLLGDADGSATGLDAAKGARVAAVVVGHRLGRKLRVFKYKPKKRYRRTHGHRSRYTELKVEAVLTAGQPLPTLAPAEAAPAPAAAEEKPAPKKRRAPKAAAPAAAEPETTAAVDDEAGDAGFEEV